MGVERALQLASAEQAVYALLAAYVEALRHYAAACALVHPRVIELPLIGRIDVTARLRLLEAVLQKDTSRAPGVRHVVEEAIGVFSAAASRLNLLTLVERPSQEAR